VQQANSLTEAARSPLAGQHAGVQRGDALVLAKQVANLAPACMGYE